MALLELEGITKNFGGLTALDDVSFAIDAGVITGLIGPNGSGKTTLINVVSGFYRPDKGRVVHRGEDITGLRPFNITRHGICRGFQLTNVFKEFTVLDNVRAAFYLHTGVGFWGAAFHTRRTRAREKDIEQQALGIIDFLDMSNVKDELAKNLPHGSERFLGLAMAVATGADMLMLDEPATGMTHSEILHMMAKIRELRDQGKTILVVEHNMRFTMQLCERIVVLNFGEKICEGSPKEVSSNPLVCEAYLGEEAVSGGEDSVA